MLHPLKYAQETGAPTEGGQRVQPHKEHDHDGEEEEIDEVVMEDMRKLEDTFPGISDRFRLVNRIGEGMVALQKSPSVAIA